MGKAKQFKIGGDVIGSRNRMNGPTRYSGKGNPHFKRLLREIKKIKRVEQLDIVESMIKETYSWGKLAFAEVSELYSKLNEQASKVGEIRRYYKVGGFEIGGEKKGRI